MTLEADLQDIATTIREFDPAAAERVESLRLALLPGATVGGWDGVDVLRAIDPAGTVAGIRQQFLMSPGLARLEWLRNLLALAPILMTWFGLKVAVDGYRDAVAADASLLDQPFLLLWQEGFNGQGSWLSGWLTLGHVALLDVILIGVMIALTWLIHTEINVRQAQRERVARALEGKLHHVVWKAALELGARTSQAARFDHLRDMTEELFNEVQAERQRIEALADERERKMADLRGFVQSFKEGANGFQAGIDALKDGVSTLTRVAKGADARTAKLAQQETDLTGALVRFNETSDRHNRIQESAALTLDQAVTQLSESASLLSQASAESVSSNANVASTLGVLQAELSSLRTQLIDERKAYAIAAEAARGSAQALDAALKGMGGASREIKEGSSTLQKLVEAFTSSAEELKTKDAQLGKVADGLERSSIAFDQLFPAILQLTQENAALQRQAQVAIASGATKDALVDAWREVVAQAAAQEPIHPAGGRKRGGFLPWRSL